MLWFKKVRLQIGNEGPVAYHLRARRLARARSALPPTTDMRRLCRLVRLVPILLQKSKVASVRILGATLKREAIDDSDNLGRVTEVAYEFSLRRRGPSDPYTKTAPAALRFFLYLRQNDFCNTICHNRKWASDVVTPRRPHSAAKWPLSPEPALLVFSISSSGLLNAGALRTQGRPRLLLRRAGG
jgi:hypothetical protein